MEGWKIDGTFIAVGDRLQKLDRGIAATYRDVLTVKSRNHAMKSAKHVSSGSGMYRIVGIDGRSKSGIA